MTTRLTALFTVLFLLFPAAAQDRPPRGEHFRRATATSLPAQVREMEELSVVLGRPTDHSVTLNILSAKAREVCVEYGLDSGGYKSKTEIAKTSAGEPMEILLNKLEGDKNYFYRVRSRIAGQSDFASGKECSFHTQRAPGSTFVFGVQGDSHPERQGLMYDPTLYAQTLRKVAQEKPDFYMMLGDDFSIERLISGKDLTQETVDKVYAYQRPFVGIVGGSSSLFLVNGNHEQAAMCNLDGTAENCAVLAGLARTRYYSLPAPDDFYGGDEEKIKHIGLLRDYYAWTWGDALFVVIDPYWHSAAAVDNPAGNEGRKGGEKKPGDKKRDIWNSTLGDAQYKWLSKTLLQSKATWKFVFCHHVLGTGRGGVECATLGEWGGKNKRGEDQFASRRPGWDLPIHKLMVKAGVTIFFQGHDHVFARQELDGVVYQSCPNPADSTYTAFNRDSYRSGDILPNCGHLRVTVAAAKVHVEYIRSYLPADATKEHPDREVAFAYEIPPAKAASNPAPAPEKASTEVVAPGEKPVEVGSGFEFTEGPVADSEGNVYFSDVRASRTYKWTPGGKATLFREKTHATNGMAIDKAGNLICCEGETGKMTSVDSKGLVTVLAETYQGKRFNQPNDLWIDSKGGIYFTDPIYGRGENAQGGEHVYYLWPDRKKIVRVVNDMVRPNGLVGTSDGKALYIADHGASKTYRYKVNDDGTLAEKTLFASKGSDGMKLDDRGNVYITTDVVLVFDPSGKQVGRIEVPRQPTNLCFAGKDRSTLFITARESVYIIKLNTRGPLPQAKAASRASEGK